MGRVPIAGWREPRELTINKTWARYRLERASSCSEILAKLSIID